MGKYDHLKIGTSPLTGTIFLGRLNKAGDCWLDGKTDITNIAIDGVMEHLYHKKLMYTSKFNTCGKKYTMMLLSEKDLELLEKARKNNN